MPSSQYLKMHFDSVLPPTSGSSKWSLSIRIFYQTPVCSSPLPIRATCSAHLILPDLITQIIFGEQYRSLSSSLCSCLLSPVTSSHLRPKYSHHLILKHPQLTFLTQCERPSLTPIQNNKQNCSPLYLDLYIFG
jgi:hypothetical protein